MRLRSIIRIFFLLILLQSCTKDPLDGDKASLEGRWVWVQTKFYNAYATPTTFYRYPQPDQWMKVEFFKKGKITIEFNDRDHYYSENSKRIQFREYTASTNGSYDLFFINILHANYYNGISGKLLHRSNDTLVIDDLPFEDTLNSVSNYFVRE